MRACICRSIIREILLVYNGHSRERERGRENRAAITVGNKIGVFLWENCKKYLATNLILACTCQPPHDKTRKFAIVDRMIVWTGTCACTRCSCMRYACNAAHTMRYVQTDTHFSNNAMLHYHVHSSLVETSRQNTMRISKEKVHVP